MKMQSCPWALALMTVLVCSLGCSGLGGQAPEAGNQRLPFFTDSKPLIVPANTIIYVRLRQPITSGGAQAGQTFSAVLDEPLLVDSQIAVPQGAEINGMVVVAHETGRLHAGGYVRITLSSITLNGKAIAMQTSSAIAAGGRFKNRELTFLRTGLAPAFSPSYVAVESDSPAASSKQKPQAGFAANLRIGFRLTQPLNLGSGSVPLTANQ